MPNKNYVKGRRKEYAVVNQYKAEGWHIAFRSAGSHSPIDVVAINMKTLEIHLIQCKPDSMSKREKEKILKRLKLLNNLYKVKVLVK